MRSTISVALDDDNQPMLKIDYQYSEDPEDKILGKFLDLFTLQGKARLYIQDDIEPKWLIKPILYRYSMSTLDFVPEEDGHDGIVLKDASYLFEE